MELCLGTDSLVAGDDDGLVDIFGIATAREVVDGSGQTLKHGTYGFYAAETLHELVGDVAHFKRGEYQYVGLTLDGAVGSFA